MAFSPILLNPAFRSGKVTPWGGNLLRAVYRKNCPEQTGESLEMSVIPGLQSTDCQGEPLDCLIAQYGEKMTGTECEAPFPLLLKLIDARERLSVQVHPDDAYAQANEGKLGKTEAWVILRAEPGASLVLGIREGVTREALQKACEAGEGIEDLLRYVPVKAGDVYYIPSGMVHAIGGGILLYEIQQSSDVTYRFYDWNRTDSQGNRRQLHLRQALDVTRLDLQAAAAVPKPLLAERCRRDLLLDTSYFRLERLSDCHETVFTADPRHFSVLTLLGDGTLTCAGKEQRLSAGQTMFLPACCETFTLTCPSCLLSAPAHKARSGA